MASTCRSDAARDSTRSRSAGLRRAATSSSLGISPASSTWRRIGRVWLRYPQASQATSATPAAARTRAIGQRAAHENRGESAQRNGVNAAAPISRSDAGRITGTKRRAIQKCSGTTRSL